MKQKTKKLGQKTPPPLNQIMAERRTTLFLRNAVIHLFFHCCSAVAGLPTGPGCLHITSLTGEYLSDYSNSVLSAESTYFLAWTYGYRSPKQLRGSGSGWRMWAAVLSNGQGTGLWNSSIK